MTETSNVTAGRELDIEILVRVFDFPRKKIFDEHGTLMFIPSGKPRRTHMIDAQPVPAFSTSIAAAWLIADHLKAKGYGVSIDDFADCAGCSILEPDGGDWRSIAMVRAETVAMAICKAALKAYVRP